MMARFLHLIRAFIGAALFMAAGMVHAAIVFDNTPSGGASSATGMELIRDTAAGSPTGQYVGLRFSSTTALTNVYARASVAGVGYSLNPLEVADHFIGDLSSTAKTSYWYITIPTTTINGSFRVELFQGDPAQAGATSLGLSSLYALQSADVDQPAAANKLFSVTTNPTSIQLGQNFDVIACYDINSSNGTNILVNPAATSAFNPINLRLGTTKVEIMSAAGCTGTIISPNNNQLYFVGIGSASTNSVRATYNFTQVGPTAAIATPIATARVGQYKYNADFATLRTLPTPVNTTVLAKTVDVTESPTGLVVTYTITATNSGASPVTLDKLVDTLPSLPASAVYLAGSSTLNGAVFVNPIISGQVLTWNNPATASQSFTVPANNGTLKLVFKATLPSTNGLYTNRAVAYIGTTQIDATVALGDNAPAQASTAIGAPNLVVRKLTLTPSVTNSTNGTSATYTIAVTNNGTTAAGVQLSDALPAGFTFRSASAPLLSGGATRTSLVDPAAGANVPTWGNFNLPGGAGVTITFVVDVASTVTNGKYDNSASASSSTSGAILNNFDGGLAANTADDVTVSVNIALAVSKSAITPSIANTSVGATATYTLTITNNGSSNATGVKLIDALPTGFTYASTSNLVLNGSALAASAFQVITTGSQTPGTPQWDSAGGTGFTVNAGQTLAVTFVAKVASTVADGNYNNSASVAPGSNATSISNFDGATNTSDDVAVTGAILTVTKKANASVINMSPNGIASYTVTVTNSGTGPATGVKLTDALAANFFYASTSGVTLNGVVLASNAYQVLTTAPQTASSPQWDTNPSGGFTINPGQSLVVSFNASLSGNDPNRVPDGTYHNSASVSGAARSTSNYDGALAANNLDDVVVTSAEVSASKSTSTPIVVNTASGAVASYTITINNNSSNVNAQATAVRVFDALPAGFTYLSTTGVSVNGVATSAYQVITSGAQTPATPMWDTAAGTGFTINGGGANTLVINFTAKIDSSVADGVYNNSVSTTSNTPAGKVFNYDGSSASLNSENVTVVSAVLNVSKSTSTPNVTKTTAATAAVYTITVNNSGSAAATGVKVSDVLPAGFSYANTNAVALNGVAVPFTLTGSASAPQWDSSPAGGFTINAGQSLVITFTATVSGAVLNGVYHNSASASGNAKTISNYDGTLPANTAEDVAVLNKAHLTLSKTHTGNFQLGGNGVYALGVTNIGLVPTSGVITITDNLPAGLTYVSADNPGAWTCSAAGQVVTCNTSAAFALAAGASSALNLTVLAVGPAGNVVNSASVSGGNAVLPSAATLDPTVIQSAGVPVSGYVYSDANHNLQKDAGEGGVTLSLFAKLVPAANPAGPAIQAVSVDASTGLYQFSSVSPGEYIIVIDDNNTLADIAPAVLSAWVGTEMPQLSRQNVMLASTELQNLNFGLFNGNTISGRVFVDNGLGSGGIANNGVQDGGEAGLGAVSVKLTDNAGALVHDSAKTDASGNYLLWVPAALTGSALKVSETNASGFLSTGASAVAGAVYDRASDGYSLVYALGSNYSGLNFGDVPVNTLLGNQQQSALPGAAVFYPHVFTAGTAGVVSFGVSSASGWPVVLLRDSNCNGVIDSGELPISALISVVANEKFCVILRESIPGGAPTNAQDSISLQASFVYTNANPALSTSLVNKDLTTVGTPASAGLVLSKILDNPSPLPGATIVYTITYTNNSSVALGNIVINDSVLAYTSFLSAGCGASLPASLTACNATTQPAVGSPGAIAWTLGGNLQPGASGQVTFSVRVNP
jgi:uncharacterized repeat protein (TIGR01451 family)